MAAVKMLVDIGPTAIEGRVLKLAQRLYDGLEHLGINIASPRRNEMKVGRRQLLDEGYRCDLQEAEGG